LVEDLLEGAGAPRGSWGFLGGGFPEGGLERKADVVLGEEESVFRLDRVVGEAASLAGVRGRDTKGDAGEDDFAGFGMGFQGFGDPEGALEVFGGDVPFGALLAEGFGGGAAERTVFVLLVEEVKGGLEQLFEMVIVEDFLMAEFLDEPLVEDAVVAFDLAPRFLPSGPGTDAMDAEFGEAMPESVGVVDGVSVAVDAGRESPTHGCRAEDLHGADQALGA